MQIHIRNGQKIPKLYRYDQREFRSVIGKLQAIAANSQRETIVHGAAQMGAESIACVLERLCEATDVDEPVEPERIREAGAA